MESLLVLILTASIVTNVYLVVKLIRKKRALKQCQEISRDTRGYWHNLMWRTEVTEIEKFEDYLKVVQEHYDDSKLS